MKEPVIFGYKENLHTAKKLAAALGCQRHWPGSGYCHQSNHLVINWGCGGPIGLPSSANILNKYRNVLKSVDKETAFEYFRNTGVSIPDYTRFKDIAEHWANQGEIVFCRQTTEGRNGEGIVIARQARELVPSRLYTKYVNNDREFRVHVFQGEVIFFTEKGLASDAGPNPNPLIKSGDDWSMNWVDEIPIGTKTAAINATNALGLDFAAVDLGYNSETGRYWVFETNTAPGAFGRVTLQKYVDAIRKACRE